MSLKYGVVCICRFWVLCAYIIQDAEHVWICKVVEQMVCDVMVFEELCMII